LVQLFILNEARNLIGVGYQQSGFDTFVNKADLREFLSLFLSRL
jgi:hypothetical protein